MVHAALNAILHARDDLDTHAEGSATAATAEFEVPCKPGGPSQVSNNSELPAIYWCVHFYI